MPETPLGGRGSDAGRRRGWCGRRGGGGGGGGLSRAPISGTEMCPLPPPHINSTEKSLRGVLLTAASPRPARSPAHRTHETISFQLL